MPHANPASTTPQLVVLRTYHDDHLPCVDFTYNGRKLSLWWTDEHTIGAMHYFNDSAQARRDLAPLLRAADAVTDEEIDADDERCYTDVGTLVTYHQPVE